MAIQQFNATAQLNQGVNVTISARDFNITIDEPAELGGTNKGMNPVEALLGSLGACQAIVARVYAQKFDVELNDLRVEVEGDIDLDGFFGKAPVRPGYSEIRYNFIIKSTSPKANIDQLIDHLQKHCPVGDTLANPVKLVLNKVLVESETTAE